MGRVLLAHDPVLARDVAVKILRDDLHISNEMRDGLLTRMRHEAQAAARVSHPNLVTLHDMGEDPQVGLFLVFEYVNGPNLKERLRSGRLPPLQAARLARELGQALAVAHAAGIVHRDIKPENVMLSSTGAKISDFGIARIPDSTLTRTGSLVGTPAYCAPEALAGGAFSPESDQFSLAATLYEAISGERAFPGDDAVGVAAKIQTDDARPIARRIGLSDELDDVLFRGLDKDASRRFPSTAELGDTLAGVLERGVIPPARASSSFVSIPDARTSRATVIEPPPAPPPARSPARMVLGAIALSGVSVLVGYAASQGGPLFETSLGFPRELPSASASASPEPPQPRATATHKPKPPVLTARTATPPTTSADAAASSAPSTSASVAASSDAPTSAESAAPESSASPPELAAPATSIRLCRWHEPALCWRSLQTRRTSLGHELGPFLSSDLCPGHRLRDQTTSERTRHELEEKHLSQALSPLQGHRHTALDHGRPPGSRRRSKRDAAAAYLAARQSRLTSSFTSARDARRRPPGAPHDDRQKGLRACPTLWPRQDRSA